MAVKLSEKLGDPKWIRMSERIAQLMKEKKNLNANVDFYSATVYYSLGHPDRSVHPHFRDRADCRLVRARSRAAGRQSAFPAAERIRRASRWGKRSSRSTSGPESLVNLLPGRYSVDINIGNCAGRSILARYSSRIVSFTLSMMPSWSARHIQELRYCHGKPGNPVVEFRILQGLFGDFLFRSSSLLPHGGLDPQFLNSGILRMIGGRYLTAI